MLGENISIDYSAKDMNKEIQTKLEKLIELNKMGKKAKDTTTDSLTLSPGMEPLTAKNVEKIKKGLTNFEVISVENRTILVPLGQDLNDRTVSLLTQLVKSAPSLYIIRQKTEQSKPNEFTQSYMVKEDFDNLSLLKTATKDTLVIARTDEGLKTLTFKKFDEEKNLVTGIDPDKNEFTVSINSIFDVREGGTE